MRLPCNYFCMEPLILRVGFDFRIQANEICMLALIFCMSACRMRDPTHIHDQKKITWERMHAVGIHAWPAAGKRARHARVAGHHGPATANDNTLKKFNCFGFS